MEVSGPLLQAAAPATVSLEEQSYKVKIAQIRAGNLKDSEKQMQIKKLTHEVMLNLMKSEVSAPTPVLTTESIQKFSKIVSELPLALVLRVMSFIERLSLNDVNGIRHKFTHDKQHFYPITSSQFLVLVRECLTKREKTKLNELLAPFATDVKPPADHEIERCFGSIGVDFKKACLEEIVKAIQDRTLSKQDVEITARVIKKELTCLNIGRDFEFTKFSEENYKEELSEDLKRAGALKDNITQLDFSRKTIKVVPNILGEFTNLMELSFNYCPRLKTPPDLSGNEKLKKLSFSNCVTLTAPPDLSGHKSLTELDFRNCISLERAPDLRGNGKLTHLYLDRCRNLQIPPDLSGNEKLTHMSFDRCTSLETPPDLSRNTRLFSLSFVGCINLQTPPDLRNNPILTELWFSDCTSLERSPDLNSNQALTCLSFNNCTSLTALPDLGELTHLHTLATTGVFPENPELNREVDEDFEDAQELIRAIKEYKKNPKRKLEASASAEAPREKKDRPDDSDPESDEFEAFAAQVASNWTGPKLS